MSRCFIPDAKPLPGALATHLAIGVHRDALDRMPLPQNEALTPCDCMAAIFEDSQREVRGALRA